MPRHKEFDRSEALHKAMEVFWSRGYEATSIQDLVEHMGINRQSIYDTFGVKRALYLQALDHYREVECRKVFEVLDEPGSVKTAMRRLFESIVDRTLSDPKRRGCLMGDAMSELAGRCRKTADRTRGYVTTAEESFYRALLRGKREGQLKALRDPRAVARFLCSSLQGITLMAKTSRDRDTLMDVISVTLSVLD